MSQRLKNILIIIAVLAGIMVLIIILGKALPKQETGSETSTETASAIENDDVTALFPDEGDATHRFKNECGKFVEYINTCFESATGEDMYDLINKEAMISRTGTYISADSFNEAVGNLKKQMPKGKLFLKDVTLFEQDKDYSPAAIITSIYAEPLEDSQFEYDFQKGRTLYIYVYTGSDNHIRSFFFLDLEKGELGTRK